MLLIRKITHQGKIPSFIIDGSYMLNNEDSKVRLLFILEELERYNYLSANTDWAYFLKKKNGS